MATAESWFQLQRPWERRLQSKERTRVCVVFIAGTWTSLVSAGHTGSAIRPDTWPTTAPARAASLQVIDPLIELWLID